MLLLLPKPVFKTIPFTALRGTPRRSGRTPLARATRTGKVSGPSRWEERNLSQPHIFSEVMLMSRERSKAHHFSCLCSCHRELLSNASYVCTSTSRNFPSRASTTRIHSSNILPDLFLNIKHKTLYYTSLVLGFFQMFFSTKKNSLGPWKERKSYNNRMFSAHVLPQAKHHPNEVPFTRPTWRIRWRFLERRW